MPWPFHAKAELMKVIRLKTGRDDRGWNELARFFAGASIHPVDAWFSFARRRMAGFKRGLPTASNDKHIWHTCSCHDPGAVPKVAEILRLSHNYMLALPDSGGQTPPCASALPKGKFTRAICLPGRVDVGNCLARLRQSWSLARHGFVSPR